MMNRYESCFPFILYLSEKIFLLLIMENIRGSIDEFGNKVTKNFSLASDYLFDPNCGSVRTIYKYLGIVFFVVTLCMLLFMFGRTPVGMIIFLQILVCGFAIYFIYLNRNWPNVAECVQSGEWRD